MDDDMPSFVFIEIIGSMSLLETKFFFGNAVGTLSTSQGPKKHISSKIIVIILLVTCTTTAFLASFVCYVFRRDRCPIQLPIFSLDKETSCNSTPNLICNRNFLVPETKVTINSPINKFTG